MLAELFADVLCLEFQEALHVVAIGAQGMRARALLMRQRRQPFAFQSFGRSSHARIVRSSARAKNPRSAVVSAPSKHLLARAQHALRRRRVTPDAQAEHRHAFVLACRFAQQKIAAAGKDRAAAFMAEHRQHRSRRNDAHAIALQSGDRFPHSAARSAPKLVAAFVATSMASAKLRASEDQAPRASHHRPAAPRIRARVSAARSAPSARHFPRANDR